MKIKYFIPIMMLIIFMTACSRQESGVDSSQNSEESEDVLLGLVQETLSDAAMSQCVMTEDAFYYTEQTYREDKSRESWTVYRKSEDVTDKLEEFVEPGQALIHYFVDTEGNVYYLYSEKKEKTEDIFSYEICLRKDDSTGQTEYCHVMDRAEATIEEIGESLIYIPEDLLKWGSVGEAVVDEQGAICLYSNYSYLFFLDASGKQVCEKDISQIEAKAGWGGIVNAGQDGCCYYYVGEEKATLQKLDMEAGKMSSEEVIPFEPEEVISIFSGYDNGILVATNESLFGYQSAKEAEHLLNWGDENINLVGSNVVQVCMDEQGYQILTRTSNHENLKQVRVEMVKESDVPEKELVTISMRGGDGTEKLLQEIIVEFNESNPLYQVELETYTFTNNNEFNQIYKDIVTGEGPDIYELSSSHIAVDVMASQGVLEDLTPYFQQSNVVKEEDLFPKVLEAGTFQDKLVTIFPSFQVSALVADKGYTENTGWTPEEVLAYAEEYPDSDLLKSPYGHTQLLTSYLIVGDMNGYVDWESRSCNFDSPEFIQLLKSVKEARLGNVSVQGNAWVVGNENFLKREYLIDEYSIAFSDGLVDALDFLKEQNMELVSYPNQSKKPYFLMKGSRQFGINSKSDCKDGAWAFLEYLLSEEVQKEGSLFGNFPSNKSAFEEYVNAELQEEKTNTISRTHSFTWEKIDTHPVVTEEHIEFLRFMTDNMYLDNRFVMGTTYHKIITEEVYTYFEGDRTAEDVAANIQNRVGLFLSE